MPKRNAKQPITLNGNTPNPEHKPTVAAQPQSRAGQKIEDLGMGPDVIAMLSAGNSFRKIAAAINATLAEEGVNTRINYQTVAQWASRIPKEIQQAVAEGRRDYLTAMVWDWEHRALDVREDIAASLWELASEELVRASEGEMDYQELRRLAREGKISEILDGRYLTKMSIEDKGVLANLLMKVVKIQESGEKFIGLNGPAGNRYTKDAGEKDDLADQLRDVVTNIQKEQAKKKDTVIDVDYEEEATETK